MSIRPILHVKQDLIGLNVCVAKQAVIGYLAWFTILYADMWLVDGLVSHVRRHMIGWIIQSKVGVGQKAFLLVDLKHRQVNFIKQLYCKSMTWKKKQLKWHLLLFKLFFQQSWVAVVTQSKHLVSGRSNAPSEV